MPRCVAWKTLGLAGALAASPAIASDWVLLGGAEAAANADYAYAGAITPLADSDLGNGVQARLWVDYLRYSYRADGTDVDAVAPGIQASLGFKRTLARAAWALYGGVGQRHTRLSPDQPAADNRGTRSGIIMLAEGEQHWSRDWRSDAAASYEFGPDSYWLRLRLNTAAASGDLRHGLAWVLTGGPDYGIYKLGYTLDGMHLSSSATMNLGVGASKARNLDWSAYLVLEFVQVLLR